MMALSFTASAKSACLTIFTKCMLNAIFTKILNIFNKNMNGRRMTTKTYLHFSKAVFFNKSKKLCQNYGLINVLFNSTQYLHDTTLIGQKE